MSERLNLRVSLKEVQIRASEVRTIRAAFWNRLPHLRPRRSWVGASRVFAELVANGLGVLLSDDAFSEGVVFRALRSDVTGRRCGL